MTIKKLVRGAVAVAASGKLPGQGIRDVYNHAPKVRQTVRQALGLPAGRTSSHAGPAQMAPRPPAPGYGHSPQGMHFADQHGMLSPRPPYAHAQPSPYAHSVPPRPNPSAQSHTNPNNYMLPTGENTSSVPGQDFFSFWFT